MLTERFSKEENQFRQNNLSIQEYDSMMGFIDDILQIRQEGYTVYSADDTSINKILQEYFPEEYGERKLLSYPIGQFVSVLNQLWDEEEEQIKLEDRQLIELFASGWLTISGNSWPTVSAGSVAYIAVF